MKMYNQVFIIFLLLLTIALALDYQKQIEYEHALNYIIDLAEEGRLSFFEEEELKRCTQSKCCICGLQFKNTSYSALHIALYHHQVFNHTQDIRILFDDKVPTKERYNFCMKYLQARALAPNHREDVCIVMSEDYYKPNVGITVAKYILIIGVSLLCIIYYGDTVHR